ncbi:MAG: Stk1 family PASTA domain-containing Ser/Thr kinase [Pseudobutyrivibrio sp.]|nr:Stk1 family PASTA domain-containing Ser/Thr kinase [Pseudobutyrivibrio sp.]
MLMQGTFIADRYEILDKVGAGGMSDVYKAKDHVLDRVIAIKVLKAEFAEDATFVAKFRTEAQSAAGLEHPNIVNIYDVGSENGMYFIVMEYVEGITLKTYIEKKGQLNFKEAVSIAIQVGRGIEAAHLKGIIHRDIKPQNIIISTEGKVKVTDFGIARAASSNTIHADVMGSVHYSSPEQARNGFVDGKSDIYSLGIVMYEMVTGRVPFDGDNTVAIAIQHLQQDMVAPSAYARELPVSLEKIILKATMKSPDRRYATISDLLMDLKKALVSPNEDFVTIVESGFEKTRIITAEEQQSISARAAEAIIADRDNNDEYYDDEYDDEYYDDEYDDGYDDEESNSKMDKIMTIMGIIVGVIIVGIIIFVVNNVFDLFHFGKDKEQTTMISVVGYEEKEALDALYDIGLKPSNITIAYLEVDENSDKAVGKVYEQSVAEGEEFKIADGKLEIRIAKDDEPNSSSTSEPTKEPAAEQVTIPDLKGYTEESAKKALDDLGLKFSRTFQNDSSVAAGLVISQSPAAGGSATAGDTIALVISQGTAAINVPNVVGKDQETAIATLNDAGLNVTSTSQEFSTNVASGCVISQSEAAGKVVDPGTNITLVISKGNKNTAYKFSFGPYDYDINYTLSTGNTGTLLKGQKGSFQLSDVAEVTINYTYKGIDSNASTICGNTDGSHKHTEACYDPATFKEYSESGTLVGTAIE